MPAPIAKGIIIAASVLVAAGLALYEVPHVRQWVDNSRRKIAIALHSLGDEIQPPSEEQTEDDEQERRRRRHELILRNRQALFRRAQEEGIAVDLDELAAIGREEGRLNRRPSRANKEKSFDDLVGTDGMLKPEVDLTASSRSTGVEMQEQQPHFRGRGMEGFQAGSVFGNPFADDDSHLEVDRGLIGADRDQLSPSPFFSTGDFNQSRESTATLEGDAPSSNPPLIDLSQSDNLEAQTASIHSLPSQHSDPFADDDASRSFYSVMESSGPALRMPSNNNQAPSTPGDVTPTDDGFNTSASVADSTADDIAVLDASLHSLQSANDDALSETSYAEVEAGQSTPGSWTDVGSDDESEFGQH